MSLYIMATSLSGEEAYPALHLEEKEGKVMRAIKDAGLEVEWLGNYATLGPYNYIDIFRASDEKTALKVSTLVRSIGGASTEIWNALEWHEFKEMLTDLKKAA
jgi:uncharacterized protein with GYD domain